MKRQRSQTNSQEPNAKRIKKNKFQLNQDVLQYILSDFLYFDDVLNCKLSNSCFDLKLYRFNFERNENVNFKKLKQMDSPLIKNFYFNFFLLKKTKKFTQISQKINTNIFVIHNNFQESIQSYFENFKNVKMYRMIMLNNINCPFPNELPSTLKSIIGWQNTPLPENLPDSIEDIHFNLFYDQSLPKNLPKSLKVIDFCDYYQQPLPNNLPDAIEIIKFGKFYNKPLPQNLPKSLKYIKFGDNFDHPIEYKFPLSIQKVKFGMHFRKEFDFKFYKSLKHIKFGGFFNKRLRDSLPETLEVIGFGRAYNKPLPIELPHH